LVAAKAALGFSPFPLRSPVQNSFPKPTVGNIQVVFKSFLGRCLVAPLIPADNFFRPGQKEHLRFGHQMG